MNDSKEFSNEFYAKNRNVWRKWLKSNHLKMQQVWLVLHKKDSPFPSVNYEEAVEEALCFGWIDSRPQTKDENTFLLSFTRRKPKSVWSAVNKKRIKKLSDAGLMMSAGLAAVEIARQNGSWTSIDDVEAMIMPAGLKNAFQGNPTAENYFNAFPNSVKKGIYQWISSAKTDGTRTKRIVETVSKSEQNIRANQWVKRTE